MFFQDATPDTSSYMILGYTIFFIVMAIYLISFYVRSRNLKQDMSMLESMKPESGESADKVMESKATVSKVTAGKKTAGKKTAGRKTAGKAIAKSSAKAKTVRTKIVAAKTKKKK